jgi:tRNA-2-methylthio-N6-dimethylallyladenosine synthase
MMSRKHGSLHGSFFIRTFGCQMNAHDSEHISGVLTASGYVAAETIDSADLVILNTCCVRESAEERVWGNLGTLASHPESFQTIAVCGCMAQRHGVDLLRRFPGVSLVFGLGSLSRLPELVESSRISAICDLGDIEQARIDELPANRCSVSRAWVPISHGCDRMCSYCVVPSVRGRERSRPPDEIVEEAERLASVGVVEVTLLGQNVNSYGRDTGVDVGLAELLEKVAGVRGIARIKFETSHPGDLDISILEVMANTGPVCEHLHLPVQSGSNRVLQAMKRGYTREYYQDLAGTARKLVKDLALSTDVIVGFPGETQRDFQDTLDLLRHIQFDSVYMFIYSPREGTTAYDLDDDVSHEEKHRRFRKLVEVQDKITRERLSKVVGRKVEVLVEGPARRHGGVMGRTRGHQVVILPSDEAPADALVEAEICGAGGHSLRGTVKKVLLEPK